MAFDNLFSPFKIGPVEIPNRTVMAPMAVCLAPDTQKVNDVYVHYFAERAKGGFGLITSSGVTFDRSTCGVPEPGAFEISREELPQVKRIIDLVHAYGSKFCLQLLHPGRQGSSSYCDGVQPVAPSAIKEADWAEMPRELTVDEIHAIAKRYADAAALAFEAGADGVDIHCAHGYLIHSFMSPRANHRTDEYGCDTFENKTRFLTEVIKGVLAIRPADRYVSVRLNGNDYIDGGMTEDDCLEVAKYVESLGVDAISISNGTYSTKDRLIEPQSWSEGCRTPMLRRYRDALHLPLIFVNHVKRPAMAEQMLEDDLCDFVCLGRPSMADPAWPNKAKSGHADEINYCVSCGSCNAFTALHMPNMCAMNPANDREEQYDDSKLVRNGDRRKVVVIGGGLVGLEAATIAAKRNFSVTLFNRDGRLGGAFALGTNVPGMEKKFWNITGFINRATNAGVDIRLNTPITSVEQVSELEPYAVVVATGGKPIVPDVPGIDKPIVSQSWSAALNFEAYRGKTVAFIGSGLTGLELAYGLTCYGAKVTVYEKADKICPAASGVSENKNKTALVEDLTAKGAELLTNRDLAEVTDDGAVFVDPTTGEKYAVNVDCVVLSLGSEADTTVYDMLDGKFERLYNFGDSAGERRLFEGIHKAHDAMWEM